MPSYIKHEIDVELTHSSEFLLELCHMLVDGDFEVVIRLTTLVMYILFMFMCFDSKNSYL